MTFFFIIGSINYISFKYLKVRFIDLMLKTSLCMMQNLFQLCIVKFFKLNAVFVRVKKMSKNERDKNNFCAEIVNSMYIAHATLNS